MRVLPAALACVLACVATGPTVPATAEPTVAADAAEPTSVPRAATGVPRVADAVQGEALPIRPRTPNGALLAGAGPDHLLYHSGYLDGATGRVEYVLADIDDGHVVRTLQAPPSLGANVRLVDTSVVLLEDGVATRSEAATGAVTGTVAGLDDVVALDDDWVLTTTEVHWFDGRPAVLLDDTLDVEPWGLRVLGDSTLAVLTQAGGSSPLVVDPVAGAVTDLDASGSAETVFAARGGSAPVVWGADVSGLVRIDDPLGEADRTRLASGVVAVGGGFAGDRLLAHVAEGADDVLAEVDQDTGELGAAVLDLAYPELDEDDLPAFGEVMTQAPDGLVVSGGRTPAGELVVVTSQDVRELGAPRPTPGAPVSLHRTGNRVLGLFGPPDERSWAAHTLGRGGWVDVPAPAPDPAVDAAALGRCADSSTPVVEEVRGRWQLERCGTVPSARFTVVDRTGFLPAFRPPGFAPTLGVDHVVTFVAQRDGDDGRAVVVTGLDAAHRSRVYGPAASDLAYATDRTGSGDPVYADASGRVRIASAAGLADRAAPVVRVTRRPASYVGSVRATPLTYAATATDAVDGRAVLVRVQTRSARPGRDLGPWASTAGSADGRVTVRARPGEQWCFRTVAVDRTGNVAATSARCSVVPLDDTAFPGRGVDRVRGARYLGGSAAALSGPGASLRLPAAPRRSSALLWLRTGPGRGRLEVVRDGRVLLRVPTAARRPGLRVVALPAGGATLRAAGRAPVLVDAVGRRRPT